MKPKKQPSDLSARIEAFKSKFLRFRVIVFVAFVAVIYVYVFMQINNFANAKPNPLMISNQSHTATKIPQIDSATIKKIHQLKDNSVNVKTLFDNARNNPFSD